MGAKERRIGHDFERLVARKVRPAFPGSLVSRGLQYFNPAQCDVEGTPFYIECKKRKTKSQLSYNAIKAFLEKAAADAKKYKDERIPLVVTMLTGDREQFVHLTLSDFICLVERHFYSPPEEHFDIVGLPEEE